MGEMGPTCSSILDHSQNQGGIKNPKRVLSQNTPLRKKEVQEYILVLLTLLIINNLELRLCLIIRCERSRLGLLLGSCGSINAVWAEGAQYTAQASPQQKCTTMCIIELLVLTWTHSFLLFPIFLPCNHPSSLKKKIASHSQPSTQKVL